MYPLATGPTEWAHGSWRSCRQLHLSTKDYTTCTALPYSERAATSSLANNLPVWQQKEETELLPRKKNPVIAYRNKQGILFMAGVCMACCTSESPWMPHLFGFPASKKKNLRLSMLFSFFIVLALIIASKMILYRASTFLMRSRTDQHLVQYSTLQKNTCRFSELAWNFCFSWFRFVFQPHCSANAGQFSSALSTTVLWKAAQSTKHLIDACCTCLTKAAISTLRSQICALKCVWLVAHYKFCSNFL